MLAGGRLTDAQFLGDEEAADAVFDEIAVNLRSEMRLGILQPIHDLEPAIVGEGFDDAGVDHFKQFAICLCGLSTFTSSPARRGDAMDESA